MACDTFTLAPPLQAALKLSEEQVQKCRELRVHLRRRFATVQMAKQCSQDLLDDMATSISLPLSSESTMQLLDIGKSRLITLTCSSKSDYCSTLNPKP